MEDGLGTPPDEPVRLAGRGEVAGRDLYRHLRAGGHDSLCNVVERQGRDRLAAQRAVARQPLGELAAGHAGRAGDEDVHGASPAAQKRRVQ
jgi:hypothetical protein